MAATTAGTASPPVKCGYCGMTIYGLWLLFKYSTVGRINHYPLYLFYVVVSHNMMSWDNTLRTIRRSESAYIYQAIITTKRVASLACSLCNSRGSCSNRRASHDTQLSFISIRQVAAASFAIEDWNVCAQTHCQTHKSEKVYQTV